MGAAEGCGVALQASCLVGFDTPGLHQLDILVVLTAARQSPKLLVRVRILPGMPINRELSMWDMRHPAKVFDC